MVRLHWQWMVGSMHILLSARALLRAHLFVLFWFALPADVDACGLRSLSLSIVCRQNPAVTGLFPLPEFLPHTARIRMRIASLKLSRFVSYSGHASPSFFASYMPCAACVLSPMASTARLCFLLLKLGNMTTDPGSTYHSSPLLSVHSQHSDHR